MSAQDLEVARQFLDVVAAAAKTGERDGLYPLLAPDVEWLTPKRDLHGVADLTWIAPRDNLDIEFGEPSLTDLGDGRVGADVHETYRVKATGDYAYACDRRIDLTIRDGKIAHYQMRVVG
jgi:ketosteroid isomerase-like protein